MDPRVWAAMNIAEAVRQERLRAEHQARMQQARFAAQAQR